MKREFTASTYIIENQRVLLIFHPKLQKWLPPGGHLEANETPGECAKREVKEETGLEIEFLRQENLAVDYWNAKSIERPYLCLLEEIPAMGSAPAHQHIDFIFVASPAGGQCASPYDIRWFDWTELQSLAPDIEIFNETLQVIENLFQNSTGLQLCSTE